MTRAYSIKVEDVTAERERVNQDLSKVDISRVIQLDELELAEMGSQDVRLRILAVSAEHNVDHAALADTVNIAELRGGKIYPGNSALGEVLAVGAEVTRFKPCASRIPRYATPPESQTPRWVDGAGAASANVVHKISIRQG